MNLKESFRYQNILNNYIDEACLLLKDYSFITTTNSHHYKSKVFNDLSDEHFVNTNEYKDKVTPTELLYLLIKLMEEKEKLSLAIKDTKNELEIAIDGQIECNIKRQLIINTLSFMSKQKPSERLLNNAGFGYRYKDEYKEEATYHYDIKESVEVAFDQELVKVYKDKIANEADIISTEIEKAYLLSEVEYQPIFSTNISFDELLEGSIV